MKLSSVISAIFAIIPPFSDSVRDRRAKVFKSVLSARRSMFSSLALARLSCHTGISPSKPSNLLESLLILNLLISSSALAPSKSI